MSCPFAGKGEGVQCYYTSYLALPALLSAQKPISDAHDEHMFITLHQTFELWFKQLLFEIDAVIVALAEPNPPLQHIVDLLQRVSRILAFMRFRSSLGSASGFQSVQFRVLELRLGLGPTRRLKCSVDSFLNALCHDDRTIVTDAMQQPNLLETVEHWLETYSIEEFWPRYLAAIDDPRRFADVTDAGPYAEQRANGLRQLSLAAFRAALMLMMTRHEAGHGTASAILTRLTEIDALLCKWRFHHVTLVQRMIGTKTGSAGSSGVGYLHLTSTRYMIFGDLCAVAEYLIPPDRLSPRPPPNEDDHR